MDVNNIKDSIKREIKAELKPRRLLRTALVPNTKGILTPLKEVFEVLVLLIAQIFVSAKLIGRDHPVVKKQVTGFNAIWMVIVDASANLEFKRENIYQIVIFYSIIGMLVFGALDFLTFLVHFGVGHAHAQALNNTNSLFNEGNSNDNGPTWINNLFPYANNAGSATGLAGALGNMLKTYNSALLALGTALALYQLGTMFIESAHHGKYGGTRYSQLYAPIRMVMGIGLLVPMNNGFNSAQIIAIEMAKMGSGLASNVWSTFESSLNSLSNNAASAPVADMNQILQKLVVDETCEVGVMAQNSSTPSTGSTTPPTWNVSQRTDYGISSGDRDLNASEYGVTFDNAAGSGDAYCGQMTIPAQQSSAGKAAGSTGGMSKVNYYEQAYVGSNGILNDVWQVAVYIYNNSQGGASTAPGGVDPTSNPFGATCSTNCLGQVWAAWVGTPDVTTTTQGTPSASAATNGGCGASATATGGTGEVQKISQASMQAFNDYEGTKGVACGIADQTTPDWTKAGFLFLEMTHNASDLYSLQNPNVSVGLPNPEILYAVNGTTPSCGFWSGVFGTAPYVCQSSGKTVANAVLGAVHDVQAGARSANMDPVAFDANSTGAGNDGSKINNILSPATTAMIAGIKSVFATGPSHFGQSIFNVMWLGNVMMGLVALLMVSAALVGSTPFTITTGLIISMIGVSIWPIGISLSIMIPLMPAARFIFGIFSWLLTLFEAMVAMPIVALVTIKYEGEGLFAHGQAGWFFLLQMMLRPVLMIFGLLGGVMIFDQLAGFINQSVFGLWFALWHSGGTGAVSALIGIIGFMYFYVFTLYACANISFQLINTIPDRVLSWIGLSGLSASDASDSVLGQARDQAGRALGNAVSTGAGALEGMRQKSLADRRDVGGTVEGANGPSGGSSANNNQFVGTSAAAAEQKALPMLTSGLSGSSNASGNNNTSASTPAIGTPEASTSTPGGTSSQFAGESSGNSAYRMGHSLGSISTAPGANMASTAAGSNSNNIPADQGAIGGNEPIGEVEGAAEEASSSGAGTDASPAADNSPSAPNALPAIAAPVEAVAAIGAVGAIGVGSRGSGMGRMAAAIAAQRAVGGLSGSSGGAVGPEASASPATSAAAQGGSVSTGPADSAADSNDSTSANIPAENSSRQNTLLPGEELRLNPGGTGRTDAKLSLMEAALVGAANANMNSGVSGDTSMIQKGLAAMKNAKNSERDKTIEENGPPVKQTQQPGGAAPGQSTNPGLTSAADKAKIEEDAKEEAAVEAKRAVNATVQQKVAEQIPAAPNEKSNANPAEKAPNVQTNVSSDGGSGKNDWDSNEPNDWDKRQPNDWDGNND